MGRVLPAEIPPNHDRRVQELLAEALDVTAAERRGLLEAAETDSELVEEVLSLLPPERACPERVGPYRILRHLASGGMGEVFLAEQSEPVHRQVAVKLVRTALAGGPGGARFRAEQQAMARLAHPNVAKLFDAGTSELRAGASRVTNSRRRV